MTNRSRLQEILWNFSRCGRNRLTLAKNPHFYHRLPLTSPNANGDEPTLPIEHNWHTHPIYVLTNIPGRIFLECGPNPQAFDNVWSTNGTLIFKGQFLSVSFLAPSEMFSGICGRLRSENIVGASLQGRPCFWCLVEPPPSQPPVELTVVPPEDTWNPVQDWREAIHQLLQLPNIKIRITENT